MIFGQIDDLYLKKTVSFRDAIIIFTSNVGREIYDRSPDVTNFSRTPFPTILHALKTETDPEDNMPYFPEAFVSRLAAGKIILLNKLRPETLHNIAVREILKQKAHFSALYGVGCDLDTDRAAAFIMYSQGGEADIRCILKAAHEFFERHYMRIVQLIREEDSHTFFRRLVFDISFDGAAEEARKLLLHTERRRILVMGKELYAAFGTCDKDRFEIVHAEDPDVRPIAKTYPAAVIAGGEKGARELFLAAAEQETLPVCVVLRRGASEKFYYVDQLTHETENGAPMSERCLSESLERFYGGRARAHSEKAAEKTAYHEAGHAVCACLPGREPSYVTITSRDGYAGYFSSYEEDVTEYTRSELHDRICIAMAGRAVKELLKENSLDGKHILALVNGGIS